MAEAKSNRLCHYWARGRCRYGDKCWSVHGKPQKAQQRSYDAKSMRLAQIDKQIQQLSLERRQIVEEQEAKQAALRAEEEAKQAAIRAQYDKERAEQEAKWAEERRQREVEWAEEEAKKKEELIQRRTRTGDPNKLLPFPETIKQETYGLLMGRIGKLSYCQHCKDHGYTLLVCEESDYPKDVVIGYLLLRDMTNERIRLTAEVLLALGLTLENDKVAATKKLLHVSELPPGYEFMTPGAMHLEMCPYYDAWARRSILEILFDGKNDARFLTADDEKKLFAFGRTHCPPVDASVCRISNDDIGDGWIAHCHVCRCWSKYMLRDDTNDLTLCSDECWRLFFTKEPFFIDKPCEIGGVCGCFYR
jgi:hypothetical protein